MEAWWNAMSSFERFFWYIAIPSTTFAVIQMIMTLLGMGGDHDGMDMNADTGDADVGELDVDHADLDMDMDHGGDFDADHGEFEHAQGDSIDAHDMSAQVEFKLFSLRSIIIMLATFSWSGIAGIRSGFNPILTILVALVIGFAFMSAAAGLFYFFLKMQQKGNMKIQNAVGASGSVYLPIPENHSGSGLVQVPVQGATRELKAVTEGPKLSTGTAIRVLSLVDKETVLVVKK